MLESPDAFAPTEDVPQLSALEELLVVEWIKTANSKLYNEKLKQTQTGSKTNMKISQRSSAGKSQ